MKSFFYSLLGCLAWVVVLLTIDLEADLIKVFAISAAASLITIFIFRLVRKPVRKWYLRNFNKGYMMSRGYVNGKKVR